MAKQSTVTTSFDESAIHFAVVGCPTLTLELAACSQEILDRARVHGFMARVVDAAALSKGATPQEKWEAMKAIVDHYNGGATEWRLTATGERGGRTSDTLAAMQTVYGCDGEHAKRMVANLMAKRGVDEKAALGIIGSADKIAAEIARIIAERAARKAEGANVDADELLGEME